MYTSFGDYLIAEKISATEANSFGLIVETESVPRYKVIQAPKDYSDLQGKNIILEGDFKAIPLPDKKHVAVDYKNIIAVEI